MKKKPFLTAFLFILTILVSCSTDPAPDALDVYFLFDVTGSMGDEINEFKHSIADIAADVSAVYPDSRFGLGTFRDYPFDPYGLSADHAFRNLAYLDYNLAVLQTEANTMAASGGNDTPESHVPALNAAATGTGDGGGSYGISDDPNPEAGSIGYPHFRQDAIRMIVLITDAPFHNGPGDVNMYGSGSIPGVTPPTFSQAAANLVSAGIRVIGIDSGAATEHLTSLALATNAVDSNNNILVFTIPGDGTGLKEAVVNGILSYDD